MEGVATICLHLPPPDMKDALAGKKLKLLHGRGLNLEFHIPVTENLFRKNFSFLLNKMVETARIMQLNEVELYFVGDKDCGPFSPRNEIESLNVVLSAINHLLNGLANKPMGVLYTLRDETLKNIKYLGDKNMDKMLIVEGFSDAESFLLKWGENNGVRSKLQVAYFQGAGRGAVASEDINIGDVALEIPACILINEDVLCESTMFHVLRDMDDISSETMLLLWSMKEKKNPHSKYRTYFNSLPSAFNTGLSFGIEALSALEGTLLFEEIMQAKEHLRQQYELLCPVLCSKYPDIFPHELYTWDQFLWACELWYSNSMKVISPIGDLKTCLVPIAGFLNHSPCAHILHYGKVDVDTNSLKFEASRPCRKGEQCFLSYGAYSSSHLITFYGFLPKGDNHYDVITLDIDSPLEEDITNQLSTSEKDWSHHMIRGSWLTKTSGLYYYGLPSPLLAHLRITLQDKDIPIDDFDNIQINIETEKVLLDTIISIFTPMKEGLEELDHVDRKSSSWDVKLAMEFSDVQRRILSSVLESCDAGLKLLNFSLKD